MQIGAERLRPVAGGAMCRNYRRRPSFSLGYSAVSPEGRTHGNAYQGACGSVHRVQRARTLAAFMVAALPVIRLTDVSRSAFLLIVSLAGLVTAIGLLKHLRWARLLAIALSALTLINMPFGSLVGVYGLAVLLSKEGARL